MKITWLSLFIINKVKFRRYILGLSARQLSLNLKHGESYVSKIEDPDQPNIYPAHEWPNLAQELKFETHDLLPPNDMDQTSDGTKFEKKILTLRNDEDMLLVVKGLVDYGFFSENKTFGDVAKHLYIEDKELESEILKETLSAAATEGLLALYGDLFVKNP